MRRSLGIHQGDFLEMRVQDDGSILLCREDPGDIRQLIGAWRDLLDEYRTVDEIMDDLRGPVEA